MAEINRLLLDAYAVGVVHDGEVVLDDPRAVRFDQGDSLIVVEEDDDPLRVLAEPAEVTCLGAKPMSAEQVTNVLVLGVQPLLNDVLAEYANYLHAGSRICVAGETGNLDRVLLHGTQVSLDNAGIELQSRDVDIYRGNTLIALLEEFEPACVLVLADHHSNDPNADDECVFRVLLHLREYRSQTGCQFSITSEMHLLANKELAALTEPDDFIISKELSALVMAQISQERRMAQLFEVLLSKEGFEVYMKPAACYVPIGVPVDLVSVGEAVANRGEVFIGLRRKDKKGKFQAADINPSKFASDSQTLRKYSFGEDDRLVVLANSY